MRRAIVGEVEIRRPKPQNDHEHACDLQREGRNLERFQKNKRALSPQWCWSNRNGGNTQQEQGQEATDTLRPGKPDILILKEICHDDGEDEAAKGRTSGGKGYGYRPPLEEIVSNNGYCRSENEARRYTKKDSLTEDELVEFSTEAREHHGDDEEN